MFNSTCIGGQGPMFILQSYFAVLQWR